MTIFFVWLHLLWQSKIVILGRQKEIAETNKQKNFWTKQYIPKTHHCGVHVFIAMASFSMLLLGCSQITLTERGGYLNCPKILTFCKIENVKVGGYSRVPNKRTGHLLENEKTSHLYALIQTYTFINFQQKIPPIRLFPPKGSIPTYTFINFCTFTVQIRTFLWPI